METNQAIANVKLAILKLQNKGFNERQRTLLILLDKVLDMYYDTELEDLYTQSNERRNK